MTTTPSPSTVQRPSRPHVQRRGLVDSHADLRRVLEDQADEPVVPLPPQEVLIHDGAGEEAEAGLRHHVVAVDGDPRLVARSVAAGAAARGR
jgi:hypothetical protein